MGLYGGDGSDDGLDDDDLHIMMYTQTPSGRSMAELGRSLPSWTSPPSSRGGSAHQPRFST